jgi:anti-anti-sigma regulatory factor
VSPTEPSSGTVSCRGSGQHPGGADRVIWLAGDHDSSTVREVIETLAQVIALDDADVVVDLSGVRSLGAPTMEVLARARDYLRVRSRALTLRSPPACVSGALGRCELADLVGPTPLEAAHPAGPAGALATWVWVPARARTDRASGPPEPVPPGAPEVVPTRPTPRGDRPAQVARPAGGRTKGLARRRGP